MAAEPALAEVETTNTTAGVTISNELTTGVVSSDSQTTTSSGDAATTAAEAVTKPVDGVFRFPVGSEWEQRLQATGVWPGSMWAQKTGVTTPEEADQLTARRHYFMGWYHLEVGQAGRAIEQFTEALKYDPENSHIMLDTARARLAVREILEARELVQKVLDRETTNVEALRLQAETYLMGADAAQGDEKETLLKSAIESLEKAREIQPKHLEVLRGLAKAYVQQQDVEKVIAAYRDIVAVDPRDTYSLLILAQVLSRMDRPEEAISYYRKVIDQRPGFIGGYIYLGQLYERLKKYGDAIDLYKQALLVDPRNVDVLQRFEEILRQIHGASNTERVIAEYKKFADEYPANTELRRILAERLQAAEQLPAAAEQYEKMLGIDPENVEALMALGKIYAEQKDFDKASQYLMKAVEINPEKLDLYDVIAGTFLARENTADAIALYRKAISSNPNAEKLYISLAALLEDDDMTTEAINVMEQAVDKVGEKPELLAVLGKFYRQTDKTELAEKTLRKAYNMEPDNLPLFGEMISLYLEEGNTTAAAEITSKTASGTGAAKDVVLSVAAEFYFNSGRFEKAMELYLLALEENPTKLDYLARLVGIANRQKLFDRSLSYVEKYGPRIKDEEKVQQLKAEVLIAADKYDEAIAIYQSLLRENPLDLSYYQFLVDAFNDADRYADAIKTVKTAEDKFGKSDPEAVLMMAGMVHYKHKKFAEAQKAFQELIRKTDGKNDDAYYFLGSVYLDQKKYEEAEKQFRKAIEINPNSANALNALGYMFAERGVNLPEAKELISQALEINPSAPHILDSMGWVLFKTGDLTGAEDYIQRAARHYEDAEIFTHLGDIYLEQGKRELAREMYQRVLELEPDRKEVRTKLQSLGNNGAQ